MKICGLTVLLCIASMVLITSCGSLRDVEWHKTYGKILPHDLWGSPCSVQETSDGGYIIAGYSNSFGAGDMDMWLVWLAEDHYGDGIQTCIDNILFLIPFCH